MASVGTYRRPLVHSYAVSFILIRPVPPPPLFPVSRNRLVQEPPPGSVAFFPRYCVSHRTEFFMVVVDAGQLVRYAGQNFVCCMAMHAFETQIEAHGTEFEVSARAHLLLYHFVYSLFCTIDVPMYTAGEAGLLPAM